MGTLSDRVRLAKPARELVIKFLRSDHAEAVHEETLCVWTRPLDAGVDDAPLKVEVPAQ